VVNQDQKRKLLKDEAAFWDEQEDAIEDILERPHDWRFIPSIAKILVRPRDRFLRSILRKTPDVKSVLDIGCGSGWFCHAAANLGIHCIGIDISPKKVEAARVQAERLGVSSRCEFHAMDVMEFEPESKVDMLTAHGSLHHFPDLERCINEMTVRLLREDGYLLFCEPNHQGMLPFLEKTVFWLAGTRIFGSWFDKELYEDARRPIVPPDHEPVHVDVPTPFNIRGESPSGLAFFGEDVHVGEIVKGRFNLIKERYFHYFVGHIANAGYVYMRQRFLRSLVRWTLPSAVLMDGLFCRFHLFNKKAEEGAWFLKNRPPSGGYPEETRQETVDIQS
jgi:2-polyprenyl-3-methyl-5-hydroxy-6-metoxy-1,4-benzoquinol methylase